MAYQLATHQTKELTIFSKQFYSEECLSVNPGEVYEISCGKDQYWTDWFIRTTAWGYYNPPAYILGMRLKKAKCFCLCGVFDQDEQTCFMIGGKTYIYINNDQKLLYFFANDVRWAYRNNKGQVKISITRKV